ncbi:MAG: serine hydrolase [Proteobacteria bacterium]|nr:serine hydrolase [Pseudomonadota bacterium]
MGFRALRTEGVAMRAFVLVLLLGLGFAVHETRAETVCAPPVASDDQWQVATPESVGLDGGKLCALVTRFDEWKEANLHGVVVVRHGKLAFEHYFAAYDLKGRNGPGIVDFNVATTHDLRSMTKSVTSLVMGVAIDRGLISDVDQSVLSFFPDYADLRTPEKDRITMRHLLTMSMGLYWSEEAPFTNENELNRSLAPYRYVLGQPVVHPAGTVWNYSGGGTALIGAVLQRVTGKRFDALAASLLLDPLGISDVAWTILPNGDPKDWCCFWMRPRDMAKIGQLVLDHGRWNGKQVVSEAWIDAATAPQIKTSSGEAYGYQFWLGRSLASGRLIDWVGALGQGGQRIFIVPKLDLVVVVTAGLYYGNDRLSGLVPRTVFNDYVLSAVDAER